MKIMQLTDMHFRTYPFDEADSKTVNLVKGLVEKEEPDLIVASGDLISGYAAVKGLEVFQGVADFLDSLGVQVAITYGNHDSERKYLNNLFQKIKSQYTTDQEIGAYIKENHSAAYNLYVNRAEMDEYEREDLHKITDYMKNHVEKQGRSVVNGKEMYYIDTDENHRILIVDSGDYMYSELSFYDTIEYEQQDWIVENSGGEDKESHLFIHIPLPEYDIAKQAGLANGNQDETECPADINTGTWSKLKLQTNVKAVYCGHDHDNDYVANYHGIDLTYGRFTGYGGYGKLPRGCRIIEFNEDKKDDYTTYIVDENDL